MDPTSEQGTSVLVLFPKPMSIGQACKISYYSIYLLAVLYNDELGIVFTKLQIARISK